MTAPDNTIDTFLGGLLTSLGIVGDKNDAVLHGVPVTVPDFMLDHLGLMACDRCNADVTLRRDSFGLRQTVHHDNSCPVWTKIRSKP